VYVVLAVGVTLCVPDVASVPDHPPVAVQLVAFVDDHESVDGLPEVITVGVADNESVGAGFVTDDTLTVADCVAVPPVPVHASVYVVLAVGVTLCVPDVASVPDHPPVAVQLVAFVDDHESVDA
jgi:hypothetical protein